MNSVLRQYTVYFLFQKLAPHLAAELDEIESRLNRLNSNRTANDSQRSDVKGDASAVGDANVSSKALSTPSAQSTPHPKPRPKVNISIGDSPQVIKFFYFFLVSLTVWKFVH